MTILITKDIKIAKQLKTRLVNFCTKKAKVQKFLSNEKVLLVTSDKRRKANVLKLPYVDRQRRTSRMDYFCCNAYRRLGREKCFQIVQWKKKHLTQNF